MKKALRIIGSCIVSIVAAFYLLIMIGGLFEGQTISFDYESFGMVFLSMFTIISAVVVWIKPRVGVWMVLVAGVLFTIFALITAGRNYLMAVMGAGGPLLIAGVLILLGVKLRHKSSS